MYVGMWVGDILTRPHGAFLKADPATLNFKVHLHAQPPSHTLCAACFLDCAEILAYQGSP